MTKRSRMAAAGGGTAKALAGIAPAAHAAPVATTVVCAHAIAVAAVAARARAATTLSGFAVPIGGGAAKAPAGIALAAHAASVATTVVCVHAAGAKGRPAAPFAQAAVAIAALAARAAPLVLAVAVASAALAGCVDQHPQAASQPLSSAVPANGAPGESASAAQVAPAEPGAAVGAVATGTVATGVPGGGAPEDAMPSESAGPQGAVLDDVVPQAAAPEEAVPGSGAAEGADPTGSAEPANSATPAHSAAPVRSAAPSDSAAPEGYRLVATSRATVEICDRLGLALAGVPSLDGLPERYAGAARTGSAMAPDLEAIRLLAPTEVVGPDTLAGDLAPGYANAGIPATFLNLRGVGGLYESADYLGEKYGAKSEAARLRAGYEAALAELAQKRGGREGPRVLILMGMPGAYVECTQHSYAGDLVALCGGENVVSDPAEGFVSWNTEELLLLDPDVILRTAHALPDLVADMFAKEFSENGVWKHFRAVREGRVYDLDSEVFGMSASFRWPEAFERLSGIFFGDGGYGL